MTRKTMAEDIGAPLANQYLVLYGVTDPGTTPTTTRVDAFLYDRRGRRLCELFINDLSGSAKSRFLSELSTLTGGTFIDKDF